MFQTQLRAFHAVASEGGFTKAAERHNVTQPTLSGQVRALEESFGVRLFERKGRGAVPTALGRRLLGITQQIFAMEFEARQLLTSAKALASGELRVGADAPYHVLPVLAALNRRYPGIRLTINFGNSEQVLRDLVAGRNEVAVLPEIGADPRLFALPLLRDRLIAFVDGGHPWARRRSIRLAELGDQRLLLREVGSTTRAIIDQALKDAGIRPAESLEIGSREAVREAVAAGLGVGIVAESEFGRDDRLHRLAVRDAGLQSVEYAVCLKAQRRNPVIAAFFAVLEERLSG